MRTDDDRRGDNVEEYLRRAIEEAVDGGWLPDRLVKSARGVWADVLRDKARTAELIFDKVLEKL